MKVYQKLINHVKIVDMFGDLKILLEDLSHDKFIIIQFKIINVVRHKNKNGKANQRQNFRRTYFNSIDY